MKCILLAAWDVSKKMRPDRNDLNTGHVKECSDFEFWMVCWMRPKFGCLLNKTFLRSKWSEYWTLNGQIVNGRMRPYLNWNLDRDREKVVCWMIDFESRSLKVCWVRLPQIEMIWPVCWIRLESSKLSVLKTWSKMICIGWSVEWDRKKSEMIEMIWMACWIRP